MSKKQEEILKECRKPYAPISKPHRSKKKYKRKKKVDSEAAE